jgi:hypothetical protein
MSQIYRDLIKAIKSMAITKRPLVSRLYAEILDDLLSLASVDPTLQRKIIKILYRCQIFGARVGWGNKIESGLVLWDLGEFYGQ